MPWQVLTCVPRAAMADDLLGAAVLIAGGSKVARGAGPLRTGAGPAVLPRAKCWVPKVSRRTPAGRRSAGARLLAAPCLSLGTYPTYLWHLSPSVWSRQRRQLPVRGSQFSACPLHWQGRQTGKPQWPGWQRSQRGPWVPSRQGHCPEVLSQMVLTEPSRLHWHAGKHSTHSVCP